MPLQPRDLPALSRLLDALEPLDDAAREAHLAGRPPEDAALVEAARQALAAHTDVGPLGDPVSARHGRPTLPRLPALPAFDGAGSAHAGEQVGPYRLLHELGRGGMGVVWLAERDDGRLRRRVALKLPRLSWDDGLAARMAREREAGARLEHPSIARLYDAGVDAHGRPYLAFECVDGEPIDAWCRTRALPVHERLRLVANVARAVAHAHSRLIVHRDLKPSNVMVASGGQVRLLDFGIAKLLDEQPPAGVQTTRLMTPRYAAPEQLLGQSATVQSDVYSLGVLLYELLTDRPPFDVPRDRPGALEAAVLQGDAAPPSAVVRDRRLARRLRGDVDAIVRQAMARAPSDRYPSAEALARDVEQHLAGLPVMARPDVWGYRWRKALRRHWLPLSAGGAVLAAVLAGSAIAVVQAQRATREAQRAQQVMRFVTDLMRANTQDPAPGASGVPPGGFIDRGAALIPMRFPDDPGTQAALYDAVSSIYADLGAAKLAVEYAQREVEALRLDRADDTRQARALIVLARAYEDHEQLAQAMNAAREARALAQGDAALRLQAAGWLANLQLHAGQVDEARAWARDADGAAAVDPHWRGVGLYLLRRVQAQLLIDQDNRFEDGLSRMREAIAAALDAEGPTSELAARANLAMARELAIRKQLDVARHFFAAGLQALSGQGPVGAMRVSLARIEWTARVFQNSDALSLDDAVTAMQREREVLESARNPSAPALVLAQADDWIAFTYLGGGDSANAKRLIDRAYPILEAGTDDPRKLAIYRAARANIAAELGEHDAADALYAQALDLLAQARWQHHPRAAWYWMLRSTNRMMQGDLARAAAVLDDAPDFAATSGSNVGQTEALLLPTHRARLLLEGGDPRAALRALPDVSGLPDDVALSAMVDEVAGQAWCDAGDADAGVPLLRRALGRFTDSPKDYAGGHLRAVLALCLWDHGNRAEARAMAAQARAALTATPALAPWYRRPLDRFDAQVGSRAHAAAAHPHRRHGT